MHGTAVKRSARSAISNGSRLFAERLDLRTPRGKRYRDLLDSYSNDLGDGITEAQRCIVRDLVTLQIISEDLQMRLMSEGTFSKEDHTQYSRISNTMVKHMKTLGLIRKDKEEADDADEMDPLTYISRKPQRERLED